MYRMQLKNKPESRVSVALKPGFRVWFGKMAGFPHGPGFSKPGFQSLLRTIWVITVYCVRGFRKSIKPKSLQCSFGIVFLLWHNCCRISLNTMTLQIQSDHVYTQLGVAISVTGIAQVCVCYSSCISLHCISLLLRPWERLRSTAMSMSVHLWVCLSVRKDISGTTREIFTNFLCMLPKNVWLSPPDTLTIGHIAYCREGVFFPIENALSAGKGGWQCTVRTKYAIYDCLVFILLCNMLLIVNKFQNVSAIFKCYINMNINKYYFCSIVDRVKWRHISMVAIRLPFCRSRPSYCA